jgi:hypothetical protein
MSTATEMITTIDTAISAIVSKKVSSYEIDGVKYSVLNLDELRELRKEYSAIVGSEDAVTNGTAPFGITGLKTGSGK